MKCDNCGAPMSLHVEQYQVFGQPGLVCRVVGGGRVTVGPFRFPGAEKEFRIKKFRMGKIAVRRESKAARGDDGAVSERPTAKPGGRASKTLSGRSMAGLSLRACG